VETIYSGVKRSKGQGHESTGVGLCTLVRVGFLPARCCDVASLVANKHVCRCLIAVFNTFPVTNVGMSTCQSQSTFIISSSTTSCLVDLSVTHNQHSSSPAQLPVARWISAYRFSLFFYVEQNLQENWPGFFFLSPNQQHQCKKGNQHSLVSNNKNNQCPK